MKAKMKKFPKTPFKLDCGDKPEVRQWLKDNGCVWPYSGQATEGHLDKKHLFVDSSRELNYCDDLGFFKGDTSELFNPFKKRSKLEERKLEARVEALEEQIKSSRLLMKTAWDLSSLPSFRCKTAAIKEEPKPVNVGRYKPENNDRYYFISESGYISYDCMVYDCIDMHNLATGNCYRTKQEAEQVLARQQALVRVNDRIDELNDTIYHDVVKGQKWYIDYISCSGDIHFDYVVFYVILARPCSVFNPLYCEENAKLLISEMEDDIKLAAGWE